MGKLRERSSLETRYNLRLEGHTLYHTALEQECWCLLTAGWNNLKELSIFKSFPNLLSPLVTYTGKVGWALTWTIPKALRRWRWHLASTSLSIICYILPGWFIYIQINCPALVSSNSPRYSCLLNHPDSWPSSWLKSCAQKQGQQSYPQFLLLIQIKS